MRLLLTLTFLFVCVGFTQAQKVDLWLGESHWWNDTCCYLNEDAWLKTTIIEADPDYRDRFGKTTEQVMGELRIKCVAKQDCRHGVFSYGYEGARARANKFFILNGEAVHILNRYYDNTLDDKNFRNECLEELKRYLKLNNYADWKAILQEVESWMSAGLGRH